jgi:hypothetical protein
MTSDIKFKIFEKKFYVYEIIDPTTNKVFYVGKGQKYRCFFHEYRTKNGKMSNKNAHLFNTINKILNSNNNLIYKIILTSDNEDECYDFEEQTIKEYGIENLCNIELSNRGVKHTKETREKISKSNTGKKCSEETKEKLSKINTGKKISEETKKKMSDSLKGRPSPMKGKNQTPESKEKISKSNIGKRHTDESIQKMKESQKGKIISDDQKEKIRKKLTKERILIVKKCENCGDKFEITIIKDGVDRSRICCNNSCSSKLANKKWKIKKDEIS